MAKANQPASFYRRSPVIPVVSEGKSVAYTDYEDRTQGMAASISAKIFSSLERLIKTEAQTAYNESMGASISQVSADNEDDRVRVMKRWDASFDENMCEDCGDMDGETVAADEPFDFKGEELMNPPAHPHCGCGTTVLVELPEEGK